MSVLAHNEVQVGFPRQEPGIIRMRVRSGRGDQAVEKSTTRTVGMRIMHADMLGRISRWLEGNGFVEAVPLVSGWINPKTIDPPEPEAVRKMVRRLKEARLKETRRKLDAYLEAAIFCLEAWLEPLAPGR